MSLDRPVVDSAGLHASAQGVIVEPAAAGVVPTVASAVPGTPAELTGLVPGGFWRRLAAAVVDTILVSVSLVVLAYVVLTVTVTVVANATGNTSADVPGAETTAALLLALTVQVVFTWLYSAFLETSEWQATPGKRLVGLKVTDLQGRPISFRRATGRWAAKTSVFLTLYLGFLVIAVTRKRQGLHDVIAGTLVVRRRKRGLKPSADSRPEAGGAFDPTEIHRALDHAYLMSQDRLPPELHAKVAEIRLKILELLPKINRFPMGSRDLFVFQRIATAYLPTSLDAYLALPQRHATSGELMGGKTALQVLTEQLDLLDWKMDEIGDTVQHRDLERLVIHGRFLEDSFGRPSKTLSPPNDP